MSGGTAGPGGHVVLLHRCHKILGPPFELALLARREVAFDTAIYPMQSCQNLPSIF